MEKIIAAITHANQTTRAPSVWIERSWALHLVAWGISLLFVIPPDFDGAHPWHRVDDPRFCLIALMPMVYWGWMAIALGIWRLVTVRPVSRLRWSALAACCFWMLVATLFMACAPRSGGATVTYAALSHFAGVTAIICSRKVGEDGGHA